jgi:hypothetical protein
MNTFARVLLAAGLALASAGTAAALRLPPAGDCRAMAAHSGVWMGTFTGTYEDVFDYRRPIYARGCFATEYECRRWVNEIQTIVINPGLMSCRPVSRR